MSTPDLTQLSDKELDQLKDAIYDEQDFRRERQCRLEDKCPECVDGYTGSETDHYPCERCGATGKFKAPKVRSLRGRR